MTINADDSPERPAAARHGAAMANSPTASPVQDQAGGMIGAPTSCHYVESLLLYGS
jgi:hypothetical protein